MRHKDAGTYEDRDVGNGAAGDFAIHVQFNGDAFPAGAGGLRLLQGWGVLVVVLLGGGRSRKDGLVRL